MKAKNFRVLFAGGGTGGHLFSGLAVAEKMRETHPHASIAFVGTPLGLESSIVPRADFELRLIDARPLKGSGPAAKLKSLARLPRAYLQSAKILKDFKPDLVVGIGGYASGPLTLAAHFRKIPTAIIEQNSIPGFTNRQLGRFVDKIFIAFAKAREFFDARKTVLSGNPTRRFSPQTATKPADRFCVFVLGGSQGAHALNQAVLDALPQLKAQPKAWLFLHQTGTQDFETVAAAYQRHGFDAEVFPFLQDLSPHYSRCDLMLCRAGAGTIAELQNLKLASILVPYPHAADDHQFYNAQEMSAAGAARLITHDALDGPTLAAVLQHYREHPAELESMREKAGALAKPHATEEVMRQCLELIKGSAIF